MKLLVTTNWGCEDAVREELARFGYTDTETVTRAKIEVESKNRVDEDIVKLNLLLRQVNRVHLVLASDRIENLEDIYRVVSGTDFEPFIRPDQSFAVRGVRHGDHGFTSMDIAARSGAAIIDSYRQSTGKRLKVDLDDPDVEFYAFLKDDMFYLTINTSGESLHKRYPRPYQHHAPLKTTIAASLLWVSGIRWGLAGKVYSKIPYSTVLDPMAGGGTIPIELRLIERQVLAGRFRDDYAFKRLSFVDWQPVTERLEHVEDPKEPVVDVIGADLFEKNVMGMKDNADAVGVRFRIMKGDARELDYLDTTVDLVVTNPPYGLRVASKRTIIDLYRQFTKAVKKHRIPKIVLLTSEGKLMENCLLDNGYEIGSKSIMYGNLPAKIIVAQY